jgi:hypothetical protein
VHFIFSPARYDLCLSNPIAVELVCLNPLKKLTPISLGLFAPVPHGVGPGAKSWNPHKTRDVKTLCKSKAELKSRISTQHLQVFYQVGLFTELCDDVSGAKSFYVLSVVEKVDILEEHLSA